VRELKRRIVALLLALVAIPVFAQDKPNVVLIFMDNFGYGELGVYGGGIIRGAPTPRIDELAGEGMRLLNFNVEAQCTPSRAAILTGRYAIRTGNASIPIETPIYGLTQWEYTIAEMLSDAGYATGMFGKWHLGHTEGRYPTDQGFDEWYGIPNSSDESAWPDDTRYLPDSHPFAHAEHIMEGRKGEMPRKLKVYNTEERLLIDGELTKRSIDFMERQVESNNPFFLFVPYTQTHMPVTPHPDFRGVTGKKEGSLRVPFIIRWPENVPAGAVSNEIVHEMDLFPTIARIAGGRVPDDRIIDGVDQFDFFTGEQENSNREHVIVYVGSELYGIKWRNYKMMSKEIDRAFGDPTRSYGVPLIYDLHTDPKEESPIHSRWYHSGWIRWPAGELIVKHLASFQQEPPIRPGTPDPYEPDAR
jgi:arylsulfatase A-like enzyme